MVKFSAYFLMILSFTPCYYIILKSPRRFCINTPYNQSTKSRITSYSQNAQIHTEDVMVARQYLPPLFRYIIISTAFSFSPPNPLWMRMRMCFGCTDCSVAPMVDCTNNHYRTLARLISKHAWLYTEMHAAETIVNRKADLVSQWKKTCV